MADRQTSIRHTHKNKDTPDNEIHVYITVSHQNIGGSVGIQYTCIYNVQECISTHKLCHRTHTHTHTHSVLQGMIQAHKACYNSEYRVPEAGSSLIRVEVSVIEEVIVWSPT